MSGRTRGRRPLPAQVRRERLVLYVLPATARALERLAAREAPGQVIDRLIGEAAMQATRTIHAVYQVPQRTSYYLLQVEVDDAQPRPAYTTAGVQGPLNGAPASGRWDDVPWDDVPWDDDPAAIAAAEDAATVLVYTDEHPADANLPWGGIGNRPGGDPPRT